MTDTSYTVIFIRVLSGELFQRQVAVIMVFIAHFGEPNFQIVKTNLEITISFVINHSPEDPKGGRGSEVYRTNFAGIVCYF